MKDTAPQIILGTAGVSNPVWFPWLPDAWQVIIAFVGFLVLLATLWGKVLDIKIKRKTLKGMEWYGQFFTMKPWI